MTLITEPFLASRRIPDRNHIVAPPGGEQAAVGAEHHAECVHGLIRKIQHDLSGACVPDGHGAVPARRGDPVALRVERRLPDQARVTFEGTNQRPDGAIYRSSIPNSHGLVIAGGDQAAAVGTESKPLNGSGMAAK